MPTSPEGPADGPTPLLLDATVLSNFVKVGRLPLLRALFPGALRAAAQVYDEIRAGGLDQELRDAVTEGWIVLVAPTSAREAELYAEYRSTLGPGEAASLAVAICRAFRFATGDRAARTAARSAGVPLTGSVGILVAAARAGALARMEGDGLLQAMKRHGYWFPFDSLAGLI